MKIEAFGGDTLLMTGYPAMLANINPVEVFHEIVGRLVSGGKPPIAATCWTSCCTRSPARPRSRPAIGSPPRRCALVEQRHLIDDAHHCPHGRPTALVFSREELDKQFRRV